MSYVLFPRTLDKHRAWHFPTTPVTTTRGTTPPGNLYRTSLNATGLPALTGDIASPCLNTFHHTFLLTSLLCEVNRAFHSFYCFLTYRLLKEVLTRINNWYAVTITMKENWSCLFFLKRKRNRWHSFWSTGTICMWGRYFSALHTWKCPLHEIFVQQRQNNYK